MTKPETLAEKSQREVYEVLSRLNFSPDPVSTTQAMPSTPPAPKFPYYHAGINLDIRDAREEQILNDILTMDFTAISAALGECTLAMDLNYPCINEHWHSVKVRSIALRVHQLKSAGQFKPPMTFGDIIQGIARGWIIGDEFSKRIGQ